MHRLIRYLAVLSVLGAVMFIPRGAAAHRLNVFASVEGSEVVVEAFFSDKGAKGAVIEVYDDTGSLIADGTTDDDGLFRFPVPDVEGGLRVVASTGEGHRGEYVMSAEDLGGAAASGGEASDGSADAAGGEGAPAGARSTGDPNLDQIVKRLVRIEADVRNVQRQVSLLRRPGARPSFERVMTGLAFIIGITGAALFVAALHKTRKPARGPGDETPDKG